MKFLRKYFSGKDDKSEDKKNKRRQDPFLCT